MLRPFTSKGRGDSVAVSGEIVVVTGASAGVGRATAVEFARRGAAKVALLARGADRLEGARRDVEGAGAQALLLEVDVADADAVDNAASAVEAQLGPIDVWVNNAMATVFSRFLEITPDEFRRATAVTYLGYVWGTLAALRRMRSRNRGTIVQVGSALAYRGIPLQAPYCGAKHAIQGFTESVRCELVHDGIDVHLTMVQLPALNTPQFDWGRAKLPKRPQPVPPIFQPEIGARAIVWAARHRRRELYVGLSTSRAIVGDKVAPAFADLYLAKTGFEAQQTPEPVEANRADNLFEPVPGDPGTHGRFDAESRAGSGHLWWTTHRDLAATAVGAVLAVAGLRGARNR
jgi:NAD(P)-dependent dehydrogenase (short-subunit alcohol dehydrogenase family)